MNNKNMNFLVFMTLQKLSEIHAYILDNNISEISNI